MIKTLENKRNKLLSEIAPLCRAFNNLSVKMAGELGVKGQITVAISVNGVLWSNDEIKRLEFEDSYENRTAFNQI